VIIRVAKSKREMPYLDHYHVCEGQDGDCGATSQVYDCIDIDASDCEDMNCAECRND
jgi:hypothetical protein